MSNLKNTYGFSSSLLDAIRSIHETSNQQINEISTGKVVHTRTGADGVEYHIREDSPTDYSIHRKLPNGKTKHIDTYGSLHRAKSVLDNEVKEEIEQVDEETYHVINKKSRMPGTVSSRAGQNIAGVTIKDKYYDRKEAAAHAKHLDKHGSSEGHEVSTWVNGKLQEETELDEETYHVINKKSRMPGTVSSRAGQNIAGVTIKDKYYDRKEAAAHAKHLDKHGSSEGHEVSTWVNGKLQEETELDEGGMPGSVIRSKQKYAAMSDQEFTNLHGHKSEEQLRQMAWTHGYGKMNPHYWNRVQKAKDKAAQQAEEFEQIDEISTTAKRRYLGTAVADLTNRAQEHGFHTGSNFYGKGSKTHDYATAGRKIKNRQVGIYRATQINPKNPYKEEIEQVDEAVPYTLGGKIDKENTYKVHRKDWKGNWSHNPRDEYHSLSDAQTVARNMKKGASSTVQAKITKHPRPKLAGPKGILPEEVEQIDEADHTYPFKANQLAPLVVQLRSLLNFLSKSGALKKSMREHAELVEAYIGEEITEEQLEEMISFVDDLMEGRPKGSKNKSKMASAPKPEARAERGKSEEDEDYEDAYPAASRDGRHIIPELNAAAGDKKGAKVQTSSGQRHVSQHVAGKMVSHLMSLKPAERGEHSAHIFNGSVPKVKTLNHVKTNVLIKQMGSEKKIGSDAGVKRGRGRPKKAV